MSARKIERDTRLRRTLYAVPDRAEEAADVDSEGPPLIALLPNRLASRRIEPDSAARTRVPEILEVQIPPHLRLTLNHMLELADETERRAQTLAWMSESLEAGGPSGWKVGSLRSTADDLRETAKRLLREMWLKPS